MALLECLRCATRFAVGLLHCPHCLSEEFQEADVPKITTSAGASHPADLFAVSGLPGAVPPGPEPAAEPSVAPEPAAVPEPAPEPAAVEEEAAGEAPAAEPEPVPAVPAAAKPKAAPSLSKSAAESG